MLPEENLCLFFLVSYQVQRTKTTATDCRTKLELMRNMMAHAETRFRLSSKRSSPFKSVGASVQSTAGSRGVRISLSNAG